METNFISRNFLILIFSVSRFTDEGFLKLWKMRFNKQELETLATQPSSKFEKEGVLYIRERQESFFRKSESKWLKLLLCVC